MPECLISVARNWTAIGSRVVVRISWSRVARTSWVGRFWATRSRNVRKKYACSTYSSRSRTVLMGAFYGWGWGPFANPAGRAGPAGGAPGADGAGTACPTARLFAGSDAAQPAPARAYSHVR